MIYRFLFTLIVFVLLFQPTIALEQKKGEELIKIRTMPVEAGDPVLQKKIMYARRLIASKNYEGAASYLEVLYEDNPDNQSIQILLKQCYSKLNLFFKLEELIKVQVKSNETNLGYRLSLAEVYAKQGKTDEALAQYDIAESFIKDINRVRYQLLIQSMLNYSLAQDAEKYIIKWRKKSGDKYLLGAQMGLIYERKKEYKKAIAEFYPLLEDTTRIGNTVEKEIVELLLFEDSSPIVEEYLLQQNKKN